MFSNSEMLEVSNDVRAVANAMLTAMREIQTPHGWSGADAEQFENQWTDLVTTRLLAAANKLDGAELPGWRPERGVVAGLHPGGQDKGMDPLAQHTTIATAGSENRVALKHMLDIVASN